MPARHRRGWSRKNKNGKPDRTRKPGKSLLSRVAMTGRRDDPDTKPMRFSELPARVRGASASAARGRDRRTMSVEVFEAIEASKEGNSFELLPYSPTPSINPSKPRTLEAGYDPDNQTLRVRFRDGTPWEYYDVPPNIWRSFKKSESPGRFINRILNNYTYGPGDF